MVMLKVICLALLFFVRLRYTMDKFIDTSYVQDMEIQWLKILGSSKRLILHYENVNFTCVFRIFLRKPRDTKIPKLPRYQFAP